MFLMIFMIEDNHPQKNRLRAKSPPLFFCRPKVRTQVLKAVMIDIVSTDYCEDKP